ncbi:MAG: 4Fe-4S binding protein [Anaerolineae bacterium]|jgi:UDP-glucose 4-epimerase
MSRTKRSYDLLMKLWPLGKIGNLLADTPLLSPLLRRCYSGEENEAIIIPVQETVRGTESLVLPLPLLEPLIARASARTILHECLCRRGEGCRAFPHDIGCLFLGEGAARIEAALGRPAALDEALDHVQAAMAAGLVPLVVHAAFDAWMLGIPYKRMLAICFCCDCCCSVRQGLRLGPSAFWETVVRLPGLEVIVNDDCAGCGTCVQVCPAGAVQVVGGRAQITEACKGCGRCVAACPGRAITLQLAERVDVVAQLLARVEARTDIRSIS